SACGAPSLIPPAGALGQTRDTPGARNRRPGGERVGMVRSAVEGTAPMDPASVIADQLVNKNKRRYTGNAKHGDGAKGGGAGRQGARMTLSDADAQKALVAADYDEADLETLKKNRGPEKAPKLWWFDKAKGTLYCFHHSGGYEWHGFPEEK